ncbi:MAG: M15 family metallopeptidase [Tissierellales bacterium]
MMIHIVDELSMANNNTSAFCSRELTGKDGVFSNHSYGIAIDINPIQNPYVKGATILPKEGVN